MSDAILLQLRHAWQASGDPTDEAALLRARVREGDLAEWRLRLAAVGGHQAAGLVLGIDEVVADPTVAFVQAVEAENRYPLTARTGLAVCRPCLVRWRASAGEDEVSAYFAQIETALEATGEPALVRAAMRDVWREANSARILHVRASGDASLAPAGYAITFLGCLALGPQDILDWVVRQATEGSSAESVRDAISTEVVPWLLRVPRIDPTNAKPPGS